MTPDGEQREAQDHEFDRELRPVQQSNEHVSLEELGHIKLNLTAELGYCDLKVREVLDLKRGSVLTLNKVAGEMADILVNGVPLAKGEVVVLGDSLHVRIAEIVGAVDKEAGGYE